MHPARGVVGRRAVGWWRRARQAARFAGTRTAANARMFHAQIRRHCAADASLGRLAVLERLPHHLDGGPLELRQFVKEQHAVMGERDLAGAGNGAAPQQADVGNRVVGRAVWTRPEQELDLSPFGTSSHQSFKTAPVV